MLTIDEIRRRLEDRRLDVVSKRTGIPVTYLYKFREGSFQNPGHERVRVLSEYLEDNYGIKTLPN